MCKVAQLVFEPKKQLTRSACGATRVFLGVVGSLMVRPQDSRCATSVFASSRVGLRTCSTDHPRYRLLEKSRDLDLRSCEVRPQRNSLQLRQSASARSQQKAPHLAQKMMPRSRARPPTSNTLNCKLCPRKVRESQSPTWPEAGAAASTLCLRLNLARAGRALVLGAAALVLSQPLSLSRTWASAAHLGACLAREA